MLTKTEYARFRALIDLADKWIDSQRGRNGWACIDPKTAPEDYRAVTNEMRSQVEVYEFCAQPPERYFLYVKGDTATTWTGERLVAVSFGRAYRDNFGGERVPVTIRAINGRTYHGTHYKSA